MNNICDSYTCSKKAKYRTRRKDKMGVKDWCDKCFLEKLAKYEMDVEILRG